MLLPLFFFKYYNFVNEQIASLIGIEVLLPKTGWMLPVGISFYTFMAIGYLVDVNNEEVSVEKNIGTVGLFLEQFDQPFTRETVTELLMGLYDSQLSDAKLKRIKLEGRIDELKQSIKITGQFLDNPVKQSPAFLQQQIETLKHEINTISDEVRQLRNSEVIYGEPVEPTLNSKL